MLAVALVVVVAVVLLAVAWAIRSPAVVLVVG